VLEARAGQEVMSSKEDELLAAKCMAFFFSLHSYFSGICAFVLFNLFLFDDTLLARSFRDVPKKYVAAFY
jgi:hypothetical protein